MIELSKTLDQCGLTYEQLIDVGILIGTDFNPNGIKGLGPKTALKLIKQYGTLENALPYIKNAVFQLSQTVYEKFFCIRKSQITISWNGENQTLKESSTSCAGKKSFQRTESENP